MRDLKQPREYYETLYKHRLARFRRLVDLKAPRVIIGYEARLIAECFEYTWVDKFRRWQTFHWPEWLLMLTSKGYRDARKEWQKLEEDQG